MQAIDYVVIYHDIDDLELRAVVIPAVSRCDAMQEFRAGAYGDPVVCAQACEFRTLHHDLDTYLEL